MFYIISYDLKGGGADYTELYEAIKSVGEWQHPLESTWVVKTDLDQNQIYEKLKILKSARDGWQNHFGLG